MSKPCQLLDQSVVSCLTLSAARQFQGALACERFDLCSQYHDAFALKFRLKCNAARLSCKLSSMLFLYCLASNKNGK
jgi:hypothetical protein